VSLSWRERARISLAPHRVALVRLARGVRGGVADRKVLAVDNEAGIVATGPINNVVTSDGPVDNPAMEKDPAANGSYGHPSSANDSATNRFSSSLTGSGWNGAIEVLGEMLAHPNIGRGDVTVVLSNHFVRYLVLPWSAELVTTTENEDFARMRFVQVFGEAARRWRISLAPAATGAGRVAAAVDQPLLDALVKTLSGSPLQLRSIEPALMSQFNAWRRQIGDDAWLVLVEHGRVLISLIHRGEWRSVRVRPIGDVPAVPLAQWLAQERLLLDVSVAPAKVCLSVVDDVAVDTEGVRVQTLSPRARHGFVPRADGGLLLAMAGAA